MPKFTVQSTLTITHSCEIEAENEEQAEEIFRDIRDSGSESIDYHESSEIYEVSAAPVAAKM